MEAIGRMVRNDNFGNVDRGGLGIIPAMAVTVIILTMKTFDRQFWKFAIFFFIAVVCICFIPWLLYTRTSLLDLTTEKSARIGDSIGGMMGPFIAIIAAAFTFLAFWVQYKANLQQELDLQKERFENKFYELLKLHKDNVNEITVANKYHGRKAFVHMFYEYKLIHIMAEAFIKKYPNNLDDVPQNLKDTIDKIELGVPHHLGFDLKDLEKITGITYTYFFLGTGSNSDYLTYNVLSKIASPRFVCYLTNYLRDFQGRINKDIPHRKDIIESELGDKVNIDSNFDIPTYPILHGHVSKLGHYYRHLFLTVKFVSEYDSKVLSPTDKYEYIKILRAQLSAHEQLMLYYNSLASFGSPWRKEKFIQNFRIIKNIPLPLATLGARPEKVFAKEIEDYKKLGLSFFEWHEEN